MPWHFSKLKLRMEFHDISSIAFHGYDGVHEQISFEHAEDGVHGNFSSLIAEDGGTMTISPEHAEDFFLSMT